MCPTERLGYNNIDELKSHPFFLGIDFVKLAAGELDDPGFDNSNLLTNMSEDDCSRNCSRSRLQKGTDSSSTVTSMSEGNGSPIIMSGMVRKRNKIFFFKKRNMYVLESGLVIIKKMNGRTEESIQLTKASEITELKESRVQIKTNKIKKILESEDAGVWVCVLNVLKMRDPQAYN